MRKLSLWFIYNYGGIIPEINVYFFLTLAEPRGSTRVSY